MKHVISTGTIDARSITSASIYDAWLEDHNKDVRDAERAERARDKGFMRVFLLVSLVAAVSLLWLTCR